MPVTDIYGGLTPQPKSVADFDNENLLMQGKRQQLRANALAMQGTQADLQAKQNMLAQRGALAQAMQSGQLDLMNPDHQSRALAIAPDVAPGMLKTVQEGLTSRAKAGLDTAQAGEATAKTGKLVSDTAIQNTEFMARSLPSVTNPTQLAQWYKAGIDKGLITSEQAQKEFAQIPINDPAAMADWIKNKTQEGVSTVEKLKMAQQAQLAADTNKTHIQTANIAAGASRANNAATIAKDYKVAGIDPQTGNFVGAGAGPEGGGMSGMVDALGSYKLDPNTAFARMAPAMKAGVIAQVQQKYPDYDPTTYAAKVKGAKDFSTGSQGNAMRSFAVAGQHLDQLGTLVDALGNRDLQIVNKIGNLYATQTGNPAPTNFDAAKDVVSKEVVKAIVAGGGGVAERQELSHLMENAKSPAQLKGVISQYRNLMAAQHDALLQQRDAAGLPRSTLPIYTDPNGSPKPGGMPSASDIDAEIARRKKGK